MENIASEPASLFRQTAQTVDGLMALVNEIVPRFCTEMLYGCHVSNDCRDNPIKVQRKTVGHSA